MRIHRSILLLFLFLGLSSWSSAAHKKTDLTATATDLPYLVDLQRVLSHYDDVERLMHGTAAGFLLADLDGDGQDELISARAGAVIAAKLSAIGGAKSLWWHNLPAEYSWSYPSASLMRAVDGDRDGNLEIIVCSHDRTRRQWRLWSLDGTTGETRWEVPLPIGPDRNKDSTWAGQFSFGGVVDVPTPDGDRPAYVITCSAGHDLLPRGILTLDVATGETVWSVSTAGQPNKSTTEVVDLDGDGNPEIIVMTTAVRNYKKDENLDGRRDDRLRVMVLEADGSIRWRISEEIRGGGGAIATSDLDGDGSLEVIMTTHWPLAEFNFIKVLSSQDGSTISTTEIEHQPTSQVLVQGSEDRPARLLVSRIDHGVGAYDWTPGGWVLAAEIEHFLQLQTRGISDILPDQGDEVVLYDTRGSLYIINTDLELLAKYEDFKSTPSTLRFQHTSGTFPLLWAHPRIDFDGYVVTISPNPDTGLSPLLFLSALPVLLAGVYVLRRHYRTMDKVELGTRDARLQLLGQLELAGHGAIGALKTLRRITWLLQSMAIGGSVEGKRLQELCQEYFEHALPVVRAVLGLSGAADITDHTIMRAKESLALVEQELTVIYDHTFALDIVNAHLTDLRAAGDDLERDLQRLRAEVAGHVRAEIGAVCERVRLLLDEELQSAEVSLEYHAPDEELWCRIDPEELVFILDNLVQNALRAMGDSGAKSLLVSWKLDDGAIECNVTDSGRGIVPDDWETIFKVGYSSREGGGLGLSRSRDILRKYEGSLAVAESCLGEGTTMRLRLPRASSVE
jgi:signal transduction histidine kinase